MPDTQFLLNALQTLTDLPWQEDTTTKNICFKGRSLSINILKIKWLVSQGCIEVDIRHIPKSRDAVYFIKAYDENKLAELVANQPSLHAQAETAATLLTQITQTSWKADDFLLTTTNPVFEEVNFELQDRLQDLEKLGAIKNWGMFTHPAQDGTYRFHGHINDFNIEKLEEALPKIQAQEQIRQTEMTLAAELLTQITNVPYQVTQFLLTTPRPTSNTDYHKLLDYLEELEKQGAIEVEPDRITISKFNIEKLKEAAQASPSRRADNKNWTTVTEKGKDFGIQ